MTGPERTPVRVTEDLRLEVDQPQAALTPHEALRLAERLTLAAMLRQASLLPPRRVQRLRARRMGAL